MCSKLGGADVCLTLERVPVCHVCQELTQDRHIKPIQKQEVVRQLSHLVFIQPLQRVQINR